MTIISSEILSNVVQASGKISVVEEHTSDIGDIITKTYMAPQGSDINALLIQHGIEADNQLRTAERERLVSKAVNGKNVINDDVVYTTKRKVIKGVLSVFLRSESNDARLMLNTVSGLSDAQIDLDFAAKRIKIKRRITSLLEIQTDIDVDGVDVEEEV